MIERTVKIGTVEHDGIPPDVNEKGHLKHYLVCVVDGVHSHTVQATVNPNRGDGLIWGVCAWGKVLPPEAVSHYLDISDLFPTVCSTKEGDK